MELRAGSGPRRTRCPQPRGHLPCSGAPGAGDRAHNSAPPRPRPTGARPAPAPPPSPPRPQEPTSGDGGCGGGPRTRFPQTRGRAEEEAAEHPPASADFAPSAPGPRGAEKGRPRRVARTGGGGGAGRRRRGRPRLPLCCAARAEEAEVGGGGSSASRSLRGSWRRRSAHPGLSGPGGRGAGCSDPDPGPGRCGDSSAPRRRPSPAQPSPPARPPAASAAAAAASSSPAAGDMSNPGGRRNGPVKLRLTGELGGRASAAPVGRQRAGVAVGGGVGRESGRGKA